MVHDLRGYVWLGLGVTGELPKNEARKLSISEASSFLGFSKDVCNFIITLAQ